MLFSSFQFAVFAAVAFPIYWLAPSRFRNAVLLIASLLFYACWDWRFVGLLLLSTSVAYVCTRAMIKARDERGRRALLALSVGTDLSILAFFKYFNFFTSFKLPELILPVGISFYTFQSIGYAIDVYRREIDPPSRFRDFAVFVSMFPQLVAGPIERAKNILPQVVGRRGISAKQIEEGALLFAWGLFQKLVIADNLAIIVERLFSPSPAYRGSLTLLGVYAFAFQIYGDFAGYSNMARGLGKWLGFELTINFDRPYLATNPRDFWRRWHISLSSWLSDYLYKPLGGSRGGTLATVRNLSLTMILGGLWHGAEWKFVAWGAYHGVLLVLYRFVFGARDAQAPVWLRRLLFFQFVCAGWLLFRASSLEQARHMAVAVFRNFDLSALLTARNDLVWVVALATLTLGFEALQKSARDALAVFSWPTWARAVTYLALFYLITIFGVNDATSFIYFQF